MAALGIFGAGEAWGCHWQTETGEALTYQTFLLWWQALSICTTLGTKFRQCIQVRAVVCFLAA